MDWIRRNWPDLLIGVALIAVIAGIIATLLSGGSFLPTGQRATNNPPVQSNTAPQTPVTADPVAPTGSSTTTTDTPVATIPEAPTTSTNTTTPDSTTAATTTTPPTTTDTTPPVVAVLPGDNSDTATTTPVAPDTTTTPATDTTVTTAATPVSGDPFRVSVGAFKNKENADRRADTFNAAGYPVFVATQEDLYLVLVGPYASRSEAEQVQARIKNSGLETNPTIFELDTADTSNTSSNAVTTTTTATPTTTTATPTTVATSSSSTGRYIQVGAYATVESSVPQQQRLEGLGYTTEQVQEGNLIKLLIGPFSPNELGAVQDRLNSLGIDHFVR